MNNGVLRYSKRYSMNTHSRFPAFSNCAVESHVTVCQTNLSTFAGLACNSLLCALIATTSRPYKMNSSKSKAQKRQRGVQFATEVEVAPPAAKRADFEARAAPNAAALSSSVAASLSKDELRRIQAERQGARALMSALQSEGEADGQSLAAFQAAAGRIGDASSGGAVVLTGQQARDAQAAHGADDDDDSDEGGAEGVQEEGFSRRRSRGAKADAAQYDDDASDDGDKGALGGESDDDEAEGGVLVKAEGEEEGGDHRGAGGGETRMDSGEFKLSDKWSGGARPERHTGDSPTATGLAPVDGDVPVVPFNLKAENDEGYFNAQGDYTRRAPSAEDDSWLASLDEDAKGRSAEQVIADTAAAAAASAQRAAAKQGGAAAGEGGGMHAYTALAWIAQFMSENDDTVSDAIRRVAKLAKTGGEGGDAQAWASVSQALSQATDSLLQQGAFDIYSFDQEQVQAKLLQAGELYAQSTGGGQAAGAGGGSLDSDSLTWKYKWNTGDEQRDSAVYGPYSSQQMYAWVAAKHFEGQPVLARRCPNPQAARLEGSAASGGADSDGDDLLGDLDEDEGGAGTAGGGAAAPLSGNELKQARCAPGYADPEWSEMGAVEFRYFASRE